MLDRVAQWPAGLVHGFSDRRGGVSEGAYASLNLSSRWGDDAARVEANLVRLAAAGGFVRARLAVARQVHGARAVHASAVARDPTTEADAMWARIGEPWVIAVSTADCVPILVWCERTGHVAAIHSGWRGSVANVAGATLQALIDDGADARSMRAAVGPCIGRDAFEVGCEVADQFDPAFVHTVGEGRKPRVDLVACVRAQLVARGLAPAGIARVGGCTYTDRDRWFSYRRDGAPTGQHLSFIAPPSA